MVNAKIFEREIDWLKRLIDLRFNLYFDTGKEPEFDQIEKLKPPRLKKDSDFTKFIKKYRFKFEGRLVIALCLATYLRPQILDIFFTKNQTFERHFTEFGGLVPNNQTGFLPTGETVLFLLAGGDLIKRAGLMPLLDYHHPLFEENILELIPSTDHGLRHKGLIRLSREYEAKWIYGHEYQPEFSADFPATRIVSNLDWETDLILPKGTKHQLEEIKLWADYGQKLLSEWPIGKQLRSGYRSLFYGPPGTGKTFTASLLGKRTNRDVYRVDLSMVVSKYIGETEKNLAKIFDMATNKNWILFFDEADALFGKRTNIQSSHDRYANQEISYLLQRFESFSGITILATNFKGNIDEAFSRRFESIIYFPFPGPDQRLKIWENVLIHKEESRSSTAAKIKGDSKIEKDINLSEIAEKYELTGGSIMNVVRYASLRALANGKLISQGLLLEGIKREYWKEGRSL